MPSKFFAVVSRNRVRPVFVRFEQFKGRLGNHIGMFAINLFYQGKLRLTLNNRECYRPLREHLSSRKMFFDDIRALTRYLYFESWQALLEFMLERLEIPLPKSV